MAETVNEPLDASGWASAFSVAVLDPEARTPDWLCDPAGSVAGRRFGIYRNNVVVGLTEALAANFPVLERLLGRDDFRAMARAFVRSSPPRSRLLHDYGEALPAFLESFAPLQTLPFLADVARLERARLDAYHAADADPLDGAALATMADEDLASLGFAAHPATRLIRSRFPIVTILEANLPGVEPGPIDGSVAEIALVTRPLDVVEVRIVEASVALFIKKLRDGATLLEAASFAADADGGFDLAAALRTIVAAGAFAARTN